MGNGTLYISDWCNHRVLRWLPGATSGETVAGGHGQGRARNQLNQPLGLCITTAHEIYIADSFNRRVVKWCPKSEAGLVVVGDSGFMCGVTPHGVAIDDS